MAEPLRQEEQLTTADLAGRRAADNVRDEGVEDVSRPKPVGAEMFRRERQTSSPTEAQHKRDNGTSSPTALFAESDVNSLRGRWSDVQAGFVDEPRRAVENADKLVATVMESLAQGFAKERSSLEHQWSRGDQVSTEDLRVALQRYRSFFDRLLSA